MQRILSLFTLIAMGGGVWMFLSGGGLDQLAVDPNAAPANQAAGVAPPAVWNGGTTTAPPPAAAPWPQATPASMPATIGSAAPQAQAGPTIRIAAFNIRDFGDKKMSNAAVVGTLAEIIRKFDVIAIQEISTKNERHMQDFVTFVNAGGARYDYIAGPRVGNSSAKEQFAYVFNTEKIIIDPASEYTIGDPNNLMSREPHIATFRTNVDPSQAFTFILVNVHTDPDAPVLPQELDALAEVYRVVRRASNGEDDVIMLGDFNASDRKMAQTRLGMIPGLKPLLSGAGIFSNTRQNDLKDNLLIHAPSTPEYQGNSGVYNFAQPLNLSQSQAEMVSDHFPVWAEFSAYERDFNGRIATRPGNVVR